MQARLSKLCKTPMQSGRAKDGKWLLEFIPGTPMPIDPLMGWSGMNGTEREVKLCFDSKEAALSYAATQNVEVILVPETPRRTKTKAYADNFKFSRKLG